MRLSVRLFYALAFAVCLSTTVARADIEAFERVNPTDDTKQAVVRLVSVSNEAFLDLVCGEENDRTLVAFGLTAPFGSLGDVVSGDYWVNDNAPDTLRFLSAAEVEGLLMQDDRQISLFGSAKSQDANQAAPVSRLGNSIGPHPDALISDLERGEIAQIRVKNIYGTVSTYRFELATLSSKLTKIAGCYPEK